MKCAIINDIHYGLRGGKEFFENQLTHFLEEVFFPKIKKDPVDMVVLNGDIYDNRRSILLKTMERSQKELWEPLERLEIPIYVNLGNHDIANTNTLHPNSITPLAKKYENINIIDRPIEHYHNMFFFPWICEETEEETLILLKKITKNSVIFTHLDVLGASLSAKVKSKEGYDPKIFSKAKRVFNGHIHLREDMNKKFHILGCQYQQTWTDYRQQKGFHIYNFETDEIEFVKNPRRIFLKVVYDNEKLEIDVGTKRKVPLNDKFFKAMTDKIVKIQVIDAVDRIKLENFLERLGDVTESLTVEGEYSVESEIEFDEESINKPMKDLVEEFIERSVLPDDVNKKDLNELYTELQGMIE